MDYGDVKCKTLVDTTSKETRIEHVIEFNKEVSKTHFLFFIDMRTRFIGIICNYVVVFIL